MTHRSKWMIVLSLFATFTLVAIPAIAQGKPTPPTQSVVVVNGAGQPVPTAAQGTTNVAGTVNIGNAPSVNVANTPTVSLAGGASVNVTNPLDGQSNPTPLAVLDAIQPYDDFCRIDFSGGSGSACNLQTIPSGKRLVIQEFDAYGELEGGLKPISIKLLPGQLYHFFTATFMGSSGGADYFATHQETRLYVPSNTTPGCGVTLSSTSSFSRYYCQLSGFLVDVPQ
jgi:hypothetical protein